MSHSSDEPTCPKFQPNIFDPSRCHECLRQKHLHTSVAERTEPQHQEKPLPQDGDKTEKSAGVGREVGSSGRALLTPISSQAEEGDTSSSCKEDSDSVSVVSSYCDVSRGQAGNVETSLCILSPDCKLYICEDDNSTDSCREQSEEFSCSVSTDDEYLPIRRQPTKLRMTRLDPPPHRPNPRQAWMEETRGGGSFSRGSDVKEDREKRESGYYSLGRAAGARFNEKSQPTPFRHFERGHPIFSHRNIEPKDTIPFRNPNLGVASERPIPDVFSEDLTADIPPPDPYEVAVEVEAQVGPRSPSPTPFKIAESLASTGRKGLRGGYNSSTQGSALHSRSSSPSRENLQLRHREPSSILNRTNFDGGGWSQRQMDRSSLSIQGSQGRRFESGTLPKNFKSFPSMSQSSTVSDFRNALRKTEADCSLKGTDYVKRSSSPSRREYASSFKMSPNTEVNTSWTHRISSPSRTYDHMQESRTSSSPRRNLNSSSHSLGRSESNISLNERSHHQRSGSPVSSRPPRSNFNSSSHSLRKSESITSLNERSTHRRSGSPVSSTLPSRNFNSSRHSLRKSESTTSLNERSHHQHSGSPVSSRPPRTTFNSSSHSLRQSESITSLNERSNHQRSGSPVSSKPPRSNFNSSSHSLHQSESMISLNERSNHQRSGSPVSFMQPKGNLRSTSPSFHHKSTKSITSLNERSHHRRCGSPVREGYGIEGQAQLRNLATRNGLMDQEREVTVSSSSHDSDRPRQSILKKPESSTVSGSRSWGSRSSSPSKRGQETFAQGRHNSGGSVNGHVHEKRKSSVSGKNFDSTFKSQQQKTETASSIRSHDNESSLALRGTHYASDYHSSGNMRTGSSFNSKYLHTSRTPSPSRKGNNDPPGYSVLRSATKGDANGSFETKNTSGKSKYDSHSSSLSQRGSTHSRHGSSLSRATSPSRKSVNNNKDAHVTLESSRSSSSMRSRIGTYGHDDQPLHEKRSSHYARSPSPSQQIQMHSSSQSSMESTESGQVSVGSTGRNREEYAAMADLPKVKIIHQREGPSHVGRPQSHQPVRRQELFKPASHSLSRHPSIEWDGPVDAERDWHYGGGGYLSRAHSTTSLQRSGSPTADEGCSWKSNHHRSEEMQGWMSKLDDCGEWKKHWFVLTDAGLKYYRDSNAEEKDDLDGEIDLKSCMKVSEFDVEKNYGFQIQTREAVFTLSAMTAGIRRNWIEVLKKSIRPSSSPDLTQLPDNNSDKENSHKRFLSSSRRPSSRHVDSHSEAPGSAHQAERKIDYVELSPVPASSGLLPTSQREAGEGQGREHSQWQEEKSMSSQWEAVLSRKGTGVGSNQRLHLEDEIEKRWSEFERMPLRDMSSLSSMGSRTSSPLANEALQREVASLRQQLDQLQQGGGGGWGKSMRVNCGPEAPCSRSLAAMERAHRHALEELQRQHDRQMRELEKEKERLLMEETRDTARVMEALKKKHKEELEREVEKVKRLSSGLDPRTLQSQQQAETQALQKELAGLSEHYSQKCLELNRAEQRNAEREREVGQKERDMEQLRKENLELKARLTDEMSRTRSSLTDKSSEDNKDKSCELEVLLRMKNNEIEYLHKEISCLRNELQFLTREKQLACERYAEVHGELSGMKGRTEREIQSLKEHLRLAMAALQEGQKLGNSLDH
ncbi:PREDICTED: TRIO and F-actin-binding protein isoform X2 [Cyprinodon variegatus]|uniref:TRIO and F-actin-binding protein isoform X2 n=1 Tax=Cyprinodon variegatus TaxID=28743 RepID=UPI0007429EED|nr:PREDICTED: TRIO and F-actin-binding protein isoform X2 [Cyprinodon variegatus]